MDDRYLAIADYPTKTKRLCDVRQSQLLDERAFAVWKDSRTIAQFMRHAHISKSKAEQLDRQFSSYSDHRLEKTKKKVELTFEQAFQRAKAAGVLKYI